MDKKNIALFTLAMTVIYLFGILSGYLIAKNIMKIRYGATQYDSISKQSNTGLPSMLTQRLNLNVSQSNELKSILENYRTEKTSSMNNFDAGMKNIQEKTHRNIRNILNEEQLEKFNILSSKYDILADNKPDRIRNGIRRQGMRLNQN
jgi:hypothetical protein